MAVTTKNLGLVKAIQVSTVEPTNTNLIWFDDNPSVKIHKVFDTVLASWVPLKDPSASVYSSLTGINTYVGNTTPTFSAYTEGQVIHAKISATNTGASTLNFNGLGAKAIKKESGADVVAGDLILNRIYSFAYDGTNFQLQNTPPNQVFNLKGGIDCSTNPNYPSAEKADAYVVTVAGKIGGASGTDVEIGDMIVAFVDNAGGTQAAVGADWFIVQGDLQQATETTPGFAEIATQTETNTGSDDSRIVTPNKLNNWDVIINLLGAWTNKAFVAGDYFTSGIGTWTVASGDVINNRYLKIGRTLYWNVVLQNTTIASSPTQLRITLPFSSSSSYAVYGLARFDDGTVTEVLFITQTSTNRIDINRQGGAAFPNTTNLANLSLFLVIETDS